MIYAVVGYRGVGKTSFLQRVKHYFDVRMQVCHIFDLESEIEQREGLDASSVLSELIQEISSMGGAKFIELSSEFRGEIPANVRVIWLRRASQQNEVSQRDIASQQNEYFQKIHHKEIMLSEGWDFINNFEPYLLGLKPANIGGYVTLLPEHFENPERLDLFIEEQLVLGVQHFELRDDLLPEEVIRFVVRKIPANKILISFRSPNTSSSLIELSAPYMKDWACDLGPSPFERTDILSLHTLMADESIDEAADRLLQHKAEHFKLAVPVESFVELWSGHRFFTEDQVMRTFAPISRNGRWQWYRALFGQHMKYNSVRSGGCDRMSSGVSVGGIEYVRSFCADQDQPLIFDYLRTPKRAIGFAAVLGDELALNRTPAEQSEFFLERDMASFAIEMNEYECDSLNISILQRLGMKAAAITSPLKKRIMGVCSYVDKMATDLTAVTAIVNTPSGWSGTNTDVNGVQAMFSAIEMPEEMVVWGGGGTRHILKSLFPYAHYFSARRGEEIWVEKQAPIQPEVVIWALGRMRAATAQVPPTDWRPKYVMDLNYADDSPGLEYALQVGAKYISGKGAFKSQARAQRDFYSKSL